MKAKLAAILLLSFFTGSSSVPEGWEVFKKVTFKAEYFEEVDAYFEVPVFDDELKAKEGSSVTLSGYFIRIEVDTIFVLSAMPFSSCFFCGGAGPETVAEVRMAKIPDYLGPDSFIKVKGQLELNATDINFMNFILNDAEFVKD